MPLLEISGLTVTFGGQAAVRDVSMHVEPGEVVGVVGESGAGKSTIGAAITDLLEPPGQIESGDIRLNGESLPLGDSPAMRKIRGRKIGSIFQDPLTSLDPLFTVADQLSGTLRRHRPQLSAATARAEAIDLLREVGLENAAERADDYPHQFSGGMRQRVVIALALAGNPQLLLADEPTTALDVSLQARILKLLRREAASRGIGVVLVTHDMGVVAQTADRVEIMRRGRIVESGVAGKVLQNPRHEYSQMLLAAVPPPDRKLHRFNLPGASNGGAVSFAAPAAPPTQGNLLEISAIRKTFGGKTAVEDVGFSIAAGESLGLMGESGSGKTTISRIIAGLALPDSGRVVFAGQDFSGRKSRVRRGMQMIFQDPYSSLNPRLRAGFTVAEPLLASGKTTRKEAEQRAREMLELVGLPPEAAQKWPHEFSGGQRQRIAIARALITSPRLLLCDEPTSALDVSIQAQILNLIKDLQEQLGLAMLFISHDLPVVRQMCDRIGVLKNGRLIELRPTEELFESPQTEYTSELLQLIPRISPRSELNED